MTTSAPPQRAGPIEWGAAGQALEGSESGDLPLVVPFPGGALVALLDGLGHGREAAEAARAAVPVLEERAGDPVLVLFQRCHEALRGTRGAAMTLASFREREARLTWVGVGNVDAVLLRSHRSRGRTDAGISVRGGVVGYQLPTLRIEELALDRGDTLVVATDGVRSGFSAGVLLDASPQEIAELVLLRYAKGSDDAHVLVARFFGEGA